MLAVPRTAELPCWHGTQLAEMQHGAFQAQMEARRDGGAQRLGACASPRSPAESPPCDVGCGRWETLGGGGLCLALYCPLRETYLRPRPACEKAAEQHTALSEDYGEGKPVREVQSVARNHRPKSSETLLVNPREGNH